MKGNKGSNYLAYIMGSYKRIKLHVGQLFIIIIIHVRTITHTSQYLSIHIHSYTTLKVKQSQEATV